MINKFQIDLQITVSYLGYPQVSTQSGLILDYSIEYPAFCPTILTER